MNHINEILVSYGGLILFAAVFVEQSGLPIPAVPWLLAAGALGAAGRFSVAGAIFWSAVGALGADLMWFYAGRRGKNRLLRLFPDLRALGETLPAKTRARLFLRCVQMLTLAKYMPLGTLIPLRAGVLARGSLRFLLVDTFSSLLYAVSFVLPGYCFHGQLDRLAAWIQKLGMAAAFVFLAAFAVYVGRELLKRGRAGHRTGGEEHSLPAALEHT